MKSAVLVAAGGLGTRLGPGAPKGLRELAGRSLVVHAVDRMAAVDGVVEVVVAAPEAHLADVQRAIAGLSLPAGVELAVIVGGVLRQDSVRLMLDAIDDEITHVLVHDAARSLTPTSVGDAVVDSLRAGNDAVVPVIPVVDTVARIDGGAITAQVPRSELALVQTPQGFSRPLLQRAHAECPPNHEATDDASLVLRLGEPVVTVPGDPRAMKITTEPDFVVAAAWLESV